jgi:hypothetical protein
MTTRKTTNRLQAQAAYENAHLVAQDLVGRISDLLFDMPAPDVEGQPIDWTHVGSMNEINHRLSGVVAFLEGTER